RSASNRRERVAQLVREHRKEFVPALLVLASRVRFVVERGHAKPGGYEPGRGRQTRAILDIERPSSCEPDDEPGLPSAGSMKTQRQYGGLVRVRRFRDALRDRLHAHGSARAGLERPRRCTPGKRGLDVLRQRPGGTGERYATGLVDEIDEREWNVADVRGERRRRPLAGPAKRIRPRDVVQLAERREPRTRHDGSRPLGADAEYAYRRSPVVSDRCQRERAVELALPPVLSCDDPALLGNDRGARIEHVGDLGADRVPDSLAPFCRRPAARALPSGEAAARAAAQIAELRPPPDASRRGVRKHQAQHGLQAFRPCRRRPERGRRPIAGLHEPARPTAGVEKPSGFRSRLDGCDMRRATCGRSTIRSVHVWVSKSSLAGEMKQVACQMRTGGEVGEDRQARVGRNAECVGRATSGVGRAACRRRAFTRHTSCLSRQFLRAAQRVWTMAQRAEAMGAMRSEGPETRAALLRRMDAYWRAANYLSVGQIYLLDNPLLREPLRLEHIKPRLLGHWGTTPGLNFIYVHLNRIIRERDVDMIYVTGPGHGGPALVANTWLEGTYSELYPEVSLDEEGMRLLFRQFSFPGGIPSHTAPETPGSINEGGELGYSLAHAYGAVFDNPSLIAACVIGDGEAE